MFVFLVVVLMVVYVVCVEVVIVFNLGDVSVFLIDKDICKVLEMFVIGKELYYLIVMLDEKLLIVVNVVGNELVFFDFVIGKIQQCVLYIDDLYQIGFLLDQKWFLMIGNCLDCVDIYYWDGYVLIIVK